MNKLEKFFRILMHPRLVPTMIRGTAPAIEHLDALRHLNVRTCIDVGANVGQFSTLVRYLFPGATVIAFEPFMDAARQYERVMEGMNTTLHRLALGKTAREAEFYVTSRRDSSSLLVPSDAQRQAFAIAVDRLERVTVRVLDEILDFSRITHPILLKIDVQGGELDVLLGCGDRITDIENVYLEASFVELYSGQPLAGEVIKFMLERGFELRGIFNQTMTKAFGPTQADFLFSRSICR